MGALFHCPDRRRVNSSRSGQPELAKVTAAVRRTWNKFLTEKATGYQLCIIANYTLHLCLSDSSLWRSWFIAGNHSNKWATLHSGFMLFLHQRDRVLNIWFYARTFFSNFNMLCDSALFSWNEKGLLMCTFYWYQYCVLLRSTWAYNSV